MCVYLSFLPSFFPLQRFAFGTVFSRRRRRLLASFTFFFSCFCHALVVLHTNCTHTHVDGKKKSRRRRRIFKTQRKKGSFFLHLFCPFHSLEAAIGFFSLSLCSVNRFLLLFSFDRDGSVRLQPQVGSSLSIFHFSIFAWEKTTKTRRRRLLSLSLSFSRSVCVPLLSSCVSSFLLLPPPLHHLIAITAERWQFFIPWMVNEGEKKKMKLCKWKTKKEEDFLDWEKKSKKSSSSPVSSSLSNCCCWWWVAA